MSSSLNPSREIRKAKQETEKNEDEALEHELMLVTHAKSALWKKNNSG